MGERKEEVKGGEGCWSEGAIYGMQARSSDSKETAGPLLRFTSHCDSWWSFLPEVTG